MRPFNRIFIIILIFFAIASFAVAQDKGEILLRRGITQFGQTSYDEAIRVFRDIILDSDLTGFHDEAYFWIAKSFIALGQYDDAEKNLEFFIAEFSNSPNYPESLYQRGRLLFLRNDFQSAIMALENHITTYPDSTFVANSFFWIGESLYSLGQFERAREVFSVVVEEYASSFKVEAARYRISLIDLKEREEELLKLIKWSHEEYLQALEDFQRRERGYEQALAAYQRRISDLTSADNEKQMQELKKEVTSLERQLATSKNNAETLKSQLDRLLSSQLVGEASQTTSALLDIKTELLELKSYYLRQLETND